MEKTCKQCNNSFRTDQKSAIYCSRPCADIGRQVPKQKLCGTCGKEFTTIRMKTAKYCSRACYAIGKTKRAPMPCARCATVFTPANADIKYCSKACAYADRQGRPVENRKTGESKECAQCGVAIYVTRNAVRARNFCGKACHDAYQARAKVHRRCTVCDAPFTLSPSAAARSAGRYCSIGCRNACGSWKSNSVIAGNLKQTLAAGPNKLELAGRAILDQMGLAYAEQVLIDGKFVVDVRLSDLPVVIQWDGDYWHGYRAPGDARPLDARQAKRATFDRSQDAYMRSVGLTVLRFWEHEVQHAPADVAARILAGARS